jgi:hypothetical protein
VSGKAAFPLLRSNRSSGLEPASPIDLADVIAFSDQDLLEALDAVAGKALDRLPGAGE